MPRANRYYVPGLVWHITHRCLERAFLLRFTQEKRRWVHWLGVARRRYGVSILNYAVTSNHVHLCVYDHGEGEIARSMQLIQSHVALEYNRRKHRTGAFWHDRYYATAVETGVHALRCCSYIDLNMVRAGVVTHPSQWRWCGYNEILHSRQRFRLIDRERLAEAIGLDDGDELPRVYNDRIDYLREHETSQRESCWTEAVAVGDESFVERLKDVLGNVRRRWQMIANEGQDGSVVLKEPQEPYRTDLHVQNGPLSIKIGHL
jgi:putative transposase